MSSFQVALGLCPDYEPERVQQGLGEVVDRLGGIERFVRTGQRVLLKPNLLSPRDPRQAVTTHPSVVEAMVRLVQKAGGRPLIADSAPASVPYTIAGLRRLYEATGMTAVASRTGALLNEDVSVVEVSCPAACRIRRFEVMRPLVEADVVISMPKLKTHALTVYTGATKNLFGVIPGFRKATYHLSLTRLDDFADMLLDVTMLAAPALVVMDAVVGMDGDGPAAGRPFPIGLLLASTSSVALDVVATDVVGIPALEVPTLRRAVERGLWSGERSDIEVVGPAVEQVRVAGFRRPEARPPLWEARLPRRIRRQVRQLVVRHSSRRPVPTPGRCTGCGDCQAACPAGAITVEAGLARVDDGLCIRCYCCHEVCPEQAIVLKKPLVGNLITRLRG